MIDLLTQVAGIVFTYMTVWYVIAMAAKRNDLVDIAWGLGFAMIALYTFVRSEMQPLNLLATVMTLAWGIRLSTYIGIRNAGKKEDFRYESMREQWGKHAWWKSYVTVFLLQGCLMLVIAAPIIRINHANLSPNVSMVAKTGIAIWAIGFLWEAVADLQMYFFKRDPNNKGKILREGLWRYSRHPNYFGEMLVWWGMFVVALSMQGGWLTIIGPLTITVLLLRVSGVPMLEKKYEDNPEYREYVDETNAIVPRFPKKST